MYRYFFSLLSTLIIFLIPRSDLAAQNISHQRGLAGSEKGDIKKAIQNFEKAIRDSGDAVSCFELAKIYMDFQSIQGNEKARDLLRQAMWKDAENIEYRLLYARLMKRMDINYSNYYNKILEIDSTNFEAWYELGKIYENEFYEYHNSRKVADEMLLSYDTFAEEDYNQAEFALKKAIKYNPESYDVNLHLCRLYQEAGNPGTAIPIAEKLTGLYPDSLDLYLMLGILYFDNQQSETSYSAFRKALDLMNADDREVFEYQTVLPLFTKDDREKNQDNIQQTKKQMKQFWAKRDPLYLTPYNERLLAHYVRVAYSNLKFSIPGQIKGWETDRGESVIRYGRPQYWIRLRPQLTLQTDGLSMEVKTDVWRYEDMTLAFTDDFSSGHFRYSIPSLPGNNVRSQYPGDTELFMRGLRNRRPDNYTPDFRAPKIDVPFEILQFKDITAANNGKTDIIINYELDPALLSDDGMETQPKHDCGLFFLKHGFEMCAQFKEEISERQQVTIRDRKKLIINSINCPIKPDTGMIAFEIRRHNDLGISANHLQFVVQKFDTVSLEMSDIVLGSGIEFKYSGKSYLKRKNLYILPNPSHKFSGIKTLNVYYEVYNLNLGMDRMTNFEQKIMVEPYKSENKRNLLSGFFDTIKNVLGLNSGEQAVELYTPYQTEFKDTQIYFELDMENYARGSYKLTIAVTDKLSGKSTEKVQVFYLD